MPLFGNNQSIYIIPSGSIPVPLPITATGSVGVGAPSYAPVWVTGSVGLNPTPVITANTATTGTTGLAVGNAPYQPLYVSITSSLPVTFGGLPPLSVWSAGALGVSGTVQTWTSGLQGVSGTVGINNFPITQAVSGVVSIGNWPATIGVSSSFPLQTWVASTIGVSGTVQVWTSGIQGVSGTVGVNNFPIVQAVSGSQLTGSTFAGSPVVVGGVFYISGILNSGSYVKSIQTDISGAVYVTTSGSIPISTTGSAGLQVSFGGISQPVNVTSQISVNNFPATQNVSGGVVIQNWPTVVGVSSSFPLQTWIAATVGVSGTVGVNNFPATQNVSGGIVVQNWPVTMGVSSSFPLNIWTVGPVGVTGTIRTWDGGTQSVSGTVQVWTSATQGISGTVGINNFPTVQAVSGSQLTGSTFAGSPVVVGGVFYISGILNSGSYVKSIQTDISGAVYVTTSGSFPVSTTGSAGLQVSFGGISQPITATGSIAVSTTGSSGLQVSFGGLSQPVSMSNTGPIGVFLTGSIPVTITGSAGLQISFGGLSQPVSMSNSGPTWITGSVGLNPTPVITANTATTGSAGLAVGNAPYQPLFISITSSLPVSFPAGVNVTVSGSTGLMVAAPAATPVWVTGSVALNPTPVITANTATTGSTGLAVGNAPYQPLFISITSSLPVTFGGLPPLSVFNAGTVGVSGSVSLTGAPFQVWTAATTGVSGTVGVNNFPAIQAVSGSQLTGSTFAGSPVVIGGVFYTSGILGSGSYVKSIETDISGAVYITTSGSIPVSTTGSTGLHVSFGGISQPITATGSIAVSTTGSAGLQVSFGGISQPVSMSNSGPIGVFLTGSIPVATTGSAGLQVSFGGISQPVSMSNSGPIGVFFTGSIPVTITGSAGLQVSFGGISQPVTFAGLPPLSVWNAGLVGVSGTVGVNNFPAVQAISGSQLTGSTFAGSPVVIGGIFYTSGILGSGSYVKSIETDISGAVYITTSGSLPVSTTGSAGLQVSFGGLSQPVSMSNSGPIGVFLTGSIPVTITGSAGLQVSFGGISQPITATGSIAVSTTGSAGLQVSFGGTSQPVSMSNSGPIGVFLTGSIPVTITGSAGLQVSFGGISQPVSMSNSGPIGVFLTGSIPVTITGSAGLQVSFGGVLQPVNVINFPATQNVSGTVKVYDTGIQAISGSQLTGSTFAGSPVVVGGIFYTSGILGSGSYVKSIETDISGAVYVTTSGSIPVSTTGSAGLQISFGGISQPITATGSIAVSTTGSSGLQVSFGSLPQPVSMSNTGPIGVFLTGSIPVTITGSAGLQISFGGLSQPVSMSNNGPTWITGSVGLNPVPTITANTATTGTTGLAVGNAPYQPLFISITSSLPVTFAGLPPLSVWNASPVGVSGSQLTGSTFTGSPLIMGAVTSSATGPITKALQVDASGSLYVIVQQDLTGGGTFTATAQSTILTCSDGRSSVSFQLTGTWTGQVNFDKSIDGFSWAPLACYNGVDTCTFTTGSGIFVSSIGSTQFIRMLTVSTWSGTANFTVGRSFGTNTVSIKDSLPSGGNNIGSVNVTVSGSKGLLVAKTDTYALGTIITGSTNGIVALSGSTLQMSTIGLASVGVYVSSSVTSWASANDSIAFEGTINGVDWFSVTAIPSPTGSVVTSTTNVGVWTIDSAGFNALRARGVVTSAQNWVTNATASVWLEGNTAGDGVVLVAPQGGLSFPITATGSIAISTTGSLGLQVSHGGVAQPINTTGSAGLQVSLGQGGWNLSGSIPVVITGATGSIAVTITGSAGLQVSHGGVAQPVNTTGSAGLQVSLGQGGWNLSGSIPVVITGATGSIAVSTTGSAGLQVSFGTLSQPVSMSNSGPVYVLQEVLTKGTQGVRGVSVQNLVDAGRKIVCFVTSSVSGVLGEALFNLQAMSNFALSSSAVTSSFVATNGKTLRLQTAVLTLANTTALTSSILIRMRVVGAGTDVSAKSPSIWSMAVQAGLPGTGGSVSPIGFANTVYMDFPDGFEFTGTERFGFTQQSTSTAAVFDFSVIGFEY